jgi:hypothetical protein
MFVCELNVHPMGWVMNRSILIPVVLVMGVSPAMTQAPGNQATTITAISPIFSELVMYSLPKEFRTVSERTSGKNYYVREAVLEGETVERWSQIITVTGAKDLASNPNASPQWLIEGISAGFKRACPDSFAVTALGALKVSGHDGFAAVASCGTVQSGTVKRAESTLLIGIKGSADYYTVQWAERGPPSSEPLPQDHAKWWKRIKLLSPITICPIVPGEAAPYPSCLGQK